METLRDDEDLPSPLSPAQHSCWREELHKVPILCHTYFGTEIIFFKGLMRVIRKIETRELDFWCAAIAQIFFTDLFIIQY